MPSLFLQKLAITFEAKDHRLPLDRKMKDWFNSDILDLLHEGETIHKTSQKTTRPKDADQISPLFADLMRKGNVNSAIK